MSFASLKAFFSFLNTPKNQLLGYMTKPSLASEFMGGGQGLNELSTRIAGADKWEKIQVHLLPLRTFESSFHSNPQTFSVWKFSIQ